MNPCTPNQFLSLRRWTILLTLLVVLSAGCRQQAPPAPHEPTIVNDYIVRRETPTPPTGPDAKLCPPEFKYFAGGWFTVTRTGPRHGDRAQYDIFLQPFCLARYEASQPTATSGSRGDYEYDPAVPPAQVKRGVVPWYGVSWWIAQRAVQQQGWRLPAFEELQYAAAQGDPDNIWIYGPEWDCELAELSWYETCDGHREPGAGITGGPTAQSDYGTGVYDLLGNLSEWTSTPWDTVCYGVDRMTLFGGQTHGDHTMENRHQSDADLPGCWLMEAYSARITGEHEHRAVGVGPHDDGFRPAADPGPQWKHWRPATEPRFIELQPPWYICPDTGERIYYRLPAPPWETTLKGNM